MTGDCNLESPRHKLAKICSRPLKIDQFHILWHTKISYPTHNVTWDWGIFAEPQKIHFHCWWKESYRQILKRSFNSNQQLWLWIFSLAFSFQKFTLKIYQTGFHLFCPKITQKYQPLHIMRCVDDTSFRANFPLIGILINW